MLRTPLTAQLELTCRCNHQCPHCYRLDNIGAQPKVDELSDDKMVSVLDKLLLSGVLSIIITGGEPLVRKDLAIKAIERASHANVHVSLNTNLLLLDEPLLVRMVEAGLDSVLISCPSTDPELYRKMTSVGNLSRFLERLALVQKSGLRYSVNMVINHINLANLQETAKELRDLGVTHFTATPMALNSEIPLTDLFLTGEEVMSFADELLSIQENLGMKVDILEAVSKCACSEHMRTSFHPALRRQCQAGRSVIAVSPNGDVRPCTHNHDSYGNLFSESLEDIWGRMSSWRSGSLLPDFCKDCKAVKQCGGGCRINAKVTTGALNGKDPWCLGKIDQVNLFREEEVQLEDDSLLIPNPILRSRRESGNTYLICTRTPTNSTLVSEELYRFITSLRNPSGYTLRGLVTTFQFQGEEEDYREMMKRLVRRGFFNISQLRKKGGNPIDSTSFRKDEDYVLSGSRRLL